MKNARILIVDDESLVRCSLKDRLERDGHHVLAADSGRQALARLRDGVDLVLLDYRLPDTDGLGVLREVKKSDPDTPVIFLTASGHVPTAVEAMKLGAFHFTKKPCSVDEISLLVARALETSGLRREVGELRANDARAFGLSRIVGSSTVMADLRSTVARVAASPSSTVLLTGESGTGKDLTAKVIHYAGDRARRPFINVTCSALPDDLIESELFGHERGTFTEARARKRGVLETADGGTVFLDEVSEMVPALQAKLLRFLEEKRFKRLGGSADIHVNVRIIAATNRPLEDEVTKGRFRGDLFYRLGELRIALPALRDHSGDINELAGFFIQEFNLEFKKRIQGPTPAAAAMLQEYGWPGNVRELRNAVERAMLLGQGDLLHARDFPGLMSEQSRDSFDLPAAGVRLEELDRRLVVQALKRTDGNQTRAGALLGMNRDQIRYRIEKFGLPQPHRDLMAGVK